MTLTATSVESVDYVAVGGGVKTSPSTRGLSANRLHLLFVRAMAYSNSPAPFVVSNTYGFTWTKLDSFTFAQDTRQSIGDVRDHHNRYEVFYGYTAAAASGKTTVDFGTLSFASPALNTDVQCGWNHITVGGFLSTAGVTDGSELIRQTKLGSGSSESLTISGVPYAEIVLDPLDSAESLAFIGGLFDNTIGSPVDYTPVQSFGGEFGLGNARRGNPTLHMRLSNGTGPHGGPFKAWTAGAFEVPQQPIIESCGELIGTAGFAGKLLSEVSTLTGAATSLTITNATAAIEVGDQLVCFIAMMRRTEESSDPSQTMSVTEGQPWTQSHAMEVFEGSTLRIRASHYDAIATEAFAAGDLSITFDFAGRSTRAVAMLACLRGDGIMRCQESMSETDVASLTQAEPGDATFFSWAINFTETGSGGPLGVAPNGPPDTSNPDLNWNFVGGWSVTDPFGTQKRYDFYGAWTGELTIPLPDPFVDIDWDTTNGSTDIDVCLDAYCCTLAAYWGIHGVEL